MPRGLLFGATAAAVAVAAAPARAEPAAAPAPAAPAGDDLLVEAIGMLPIGGWAEAAGPGGGAAVRVRVPLGDGVVVTARLAGIAHAARTVEVPGAGDARTRLWEVPILGGARHHVSDPGAARGYVFGEAGVVFRRTTVTVGGRGEVDTDLVLAASIGAGLELGRFDLHVAAWLADLAGLDDGIGVTVGVGGVVIGL